MNQTICFTQKIKKFARNVKCKLLFSQQMAGNAFNNTTNKRTQFSHQYIIQC